MDNLSTIVTLWMVVLVRFSNTMLEVLVLATMIGWEIAGVEPRSGDSAPVYSNLNVDLPLPSPC